MNSLNLYLIYTIIINQGENLQDVWVLHQNLLLPIELSFILCDLLSVRMCLGEKIILLKMELLLHKMYYMSILSKWNNITKTNSVCKMYGYMCKSVIFSMRILHLLTMNFPWGFIITSVWVAITKWHLRLNNKFQLTLLLIWLQGWKIITWWLFPGRPPLSLN